MILRNGVSYARAVKEGAINENNQRNQPAKTQGRDRVIMSQNNDWKGMVFHTTEEDFLWLQGCYVSKTHNPKGVLSLQNKLQLKEVFTIKTLPMGGNLVLLKPLEDEAIESFLGGMILFASQIGLKAWYRGVMRWWPGRDQCG